MKERFSGTSVTFIHVADRQRTLAFYRDTLGLDLVSADDYGDFLDLGGGLLRITVVPGHQPHSHPVLGWNVKQIVSAVAVLRDKGLKFTFYDGFEQDDLGIWTSPDGHTRIAFFADPDANVLTLSQV